MGSNVLGDAILSAIDALSASDKLNRTALMRALGNAIEDYYLPKLAGIPVGTIVSYAENTTLPDSTWLWCDGSAVSRTTYADLFTIIGVLWGAGDGTTTFNVPDFVGASPAGSGTPTGYTYNETIAFATKIDDQMQNHRHGTSASSALGTSSTVLTAGSASTTRYTGGPVANGSYGTPRVGYTTHGKLVGVPFIIKAVA